MKTEQKCRNMLAVVMVSFMCCGGIVPAAIAHEWDGIGNDSGYSNHEWDHLAETDGADGVKVTNDERWGGVSSASPSTNAQQTTLRDDVAHYSNETEPSSDAQTFMSGRICDGQAHMMEMPDGRSVPYACTPMFQGDSAPAAPQQVPTTRELLYHAATVVRADGAGLRKRPDGVSYTNRFVPTIVSVTNPTQTHVINLLGRDITITLTATNYEYSWGDGTPNTVTTSPGLAWEKGIDPNNDPRLIRHYYTPPQGWRSMLDGPYPHENREITLTTTWSGTATNPFTGDTQTINGLVTTTETTGEFPLSHLVINNTDTWEEKQGH